MCGILRGADGPPLVVAERDDAVVVVPRYGVRWGHLLVALRPHITRLSQLPRPAWLNACELAYEAACAAEQVLSPLRCYVASLGTPRDDLPMTSPHLHLHVVPIYELDDRPGEVLTWRHGVVTGSDEERAELRDALLAAWPRQAQ